MKHYQEKLNLQLDCLIQRFLELSQNQEYCAFTKDELISLVDYYEYENLTENALEVIEYGIKFFKNSPSFKIRKTRIFLYHYHFQLAMEVLDKKQSKSLSPSQRKMLELEILIVKKEFDEAIVLVEQLKRDYSRTRKILSNVFYLESSIYERLNIFDRSFECLSEALWINYTHKEALGKIWMITELSKNWNESVLLHEALLKKEHYSALTWFNLGHAYYGSNEYDKAIEAFNWCITIDEDSETAYVDLAEVLEIQGQYLEAANFLNFALSKFTTVEVDIYFRCGECYVRAEKYDEAIKVLKKGLEVFDDPDLWFWLGEAYRMQNKFHKVIEFYNNALAISDFRDDIHKSLGVSYFYLGEYEKAEEHLEKAIEFAPHDPSYRTVLASIQLNINELERVEEILLDAVEEIPCVSLQYQLAAILILNGKRKNGIKTLEEALKEEPSLIEEFFNFAPELDKEDDDIDHMIKYYYPEWNRD